MSEVAIAEMILCENIQEVVHSYRDLFGISSEHPSQNLNQRRLSISVTNPIVTLA